MMNNPINTNTVDSQSVGILVVIPVTGIKEESALFTFHKCEKCKREILGMDKFCSNCGGKIIEVTEHKEYGGKLVTQEIPIPDVREEMNQLGIKYHLPFDECFEEDSNWVFLIKEYTTFGHRSYFSPFLEEYDLKQIQKDLKKCQS